MDSDGRAFFAQENNYNWSDTSSVYKKYKTATATSVKVLQAVNLFHWYK